MPPKSSAKASAKASTKPSPKSSPKPASKASAAGANRNQQRLDAYSDFVGRYNGGYGLTSADDSAKLANIDAFCSQELKAATDNNVAPKALPDLLKNDRALRALSTEGKQLLSLVLPPAASQSGPQIVAQAPVALSQAEIGTIRQPYTTNPHYSVDAAAIAQTLRTANSLDKPSLIAALQQQRHAELSRFPVKRLWKEAKIEYRDGARTAGTDLGGGIHLTILTTIADSTQVNPQGTVDLTQSIDTVAQRIVGNRVHATKELFTDLKKQNPHYFLATSTFSGGDASTQQLVGLHQALKTALETKFAAIKLAIAKVRQEAMPAGT